MKVYIGIPMYGGACAEFVSALLKTRVVLDRCGFEVEVDIHNGCSILPKARNEIVQRFMASGFDVLLFLDSDLSWSPVDAVKVLTAGYPFSGLVYKARSDQGAYNVVLEETEGQWIKASRLGTGFMAIRREVVAQMIEAYPQTRYYQIDNPSTFISAIPDDPDYASQYREWFDRELKLGNAKEYHALFDFEIYGGYYWGEDYTFCRRWKDIGGEIWVYPDATLIHIGNKGYSGNLRRHLDDGH